MRQLLKTFKAAGDESRLRILNTLRHRSLCVCEIADVLGLAQSTVSRHLKLLEECDLLERSKDGLWVDYRLAPAPEGSLQHALLSLIERQIDGDSVRKDEEKLKTVDRNALCSKT